MDYPNIWPYLRDLYQTPGFGETTNIMHIERHYQVYRTTIIIASWMSMIVSISYYQSSL